MSKQPPSKQPNPVAAEAILADLTAKRAHCQRHGIELADQRAQIALKAHTGDIPARERLDQINAAIASHGSELASYDAALQAAGAKLALGAPGRGGGRRAQAGAGAQGRQIIPDVARMAYRSPPCAPVSRNCRMRSRR